MKTAKEIFIEIKGIENPSHISKDECLSAIRLALKQNKGSEFHKKAISQITDKERELMVKILELKSTLNELAEHNANYFGDSVMREIIEKSLLKCDGKF